ncbi:hypothetical protein KY308_01365 [Candidatus Woesearchaeota archaeon]|nr:hypothetical protein [Candidatus Woesearchaeota archaeon]
MKIIALLAVLLFFVPFAVAKIESYSIDYTVSVDNVLVNEKITLDKKSNFTLDIPDDAQQVALTVDGKEKEYSSTVNGQTISVTFLTKMFLERTNFLTEFVAKEKIGNLSMRAVLPADSVLAYPYDDKTGTSDAIFPRPTTLTTDGQHIIVIWERQNFGDSLPVLVKFKEKGDLSYLIYILIAVVIALVAFILLRKPKVHTKTIVKKEDLVEKHLKEDEEQIVNILKQRENQCEQGTLRVITGFSKAKLSGLLKELEERKIIHKEKRGKKNLVFLKK